MFREEKLFFTLASENHLCQFFCQTHLRQSFSGCDYQTGNGTMHFLKSCTAANESSGKSFYGSLLRSTSWQLYQGAAWLPPWAAFSHQTRNTKPTVWLKDTRFAVKKTHLQSSFFLFAPYVCCLYIDCKLLMWVQIQRQSDALSQVSYMTSFWMDKKICSPHVTQSQSQKLLYTDQTNHLKRSFIFFWSVFETDKRESAAKKMNDRQVSFTAGINRWNLIESLTL